MRKGSPKLIVTPLEEKPKILVFGQRDVLTIQVLKLLEKRGCQVFFRQKLTPKTPKVDYIFQFGEFDKTREILEKAVKDKARYLLVEEKMSHEQSRRAEEEIFAFKDKIDCRILRIDGNTFLNTPLLANRVLKAMFGRKEPLPSLAKPLIKKKKERLKKREPLALPKLKLLVACGLWLVACFSPYLFFGINFFLGVKKLCLFEKNFLNGNLAKAQEKATSAQDFFYQAKKTSSLLPFLKRGGRAAFLGESLSRIGVSSARVAKLSQKLARVVLGEEEGVVGERIGQLKVEIDDLEKQILLAQALYQDLELKNYQEVRAFSLGEKLKKVSTLLSSGKELCLFGKKALPLAGEILSVGEERVYLLLFQNNMELRPGGGFIGSYGLAYFKDGVLEKFATHDVYTADGQLKGHVEPPAPIKKYLDQPHFFLRDSNFWPDFAVNGQKAAWFFKKEMGVEVDGVIGINLSFAQKLLESLGGVYLPDYKEEITSENLFLKAQTLVQKGFFPGSTQKRDFLGALARGILAQVKVGEFPWLKMGKSLKEALDEKHIQIFLFDKKGQRLVEEMGWAGRVSPVTCHLSPVTCFPDYLMVVEANLGVNKANYFVKREVGLETNFAKEKVSHQLSIFYQNKSPGKTFPGGVYKNYLRVFVPKEAVLEKVKVGEKEIPGKKIEVEEEGDKKSWGVLVEIPPLRKKVVEFEYGLSLERVSAAPKFSYELFFQKQPGTEKDPLFLKFNYPKDWQMKKTNFPAFIRDEGFNYDSDLSVDRIFSIEFEW